MNTILGYCFGAFETVLLIISLFLLCTIFRYAKNVYCSTKTRKLRNERKYMSESYINNMIVVVYTHNQAKEAALMLEQLKKQDYPHTNYQIHFILDNCTDNTANILEFIGGAKLWKIGEYALEGQEEARTWLLERLINVKNTNAFIFLDVNQHFDENLLSSINKSLLTNDVISGYTTYENNKPTYRQVIDRYIDKIIKTGRTISHLDNTINSKCLIMKHSVINELKYLSFEDKLSEIKYTMYLAQHGYTSKFDPNIITTYNSSDSEEDYVSFMEKLSVFNKSLSKFFDFDYKCMEYAFSIITPNPLTIIALLALMFVYTYTFEFKIDTPVFAILSGILVISFISSLLISRLKKEEIIMLLISPFAAIFEFFRYSFIGKILSRISEGKKALPVIKSTTRTVYITDGKTDLSCDLVLMQEDGMSKVILKYKNKKFMSDLYLRMYDAVNDIVNTLNTHGFRIKICCSCGYFTSIVDGTTNMVKGHCRKCVIDRLSEEPQETVLWSGCENYIPQEVNKVVDISNYR